MKDVERRVVTLAIRAEAERQVKAHAKKKRQDLLCERYEIDATEWNDPCWKRYETVHHDMDGSPVIEQLPREEWCQNCRDRQAAHEEYRRSSDRLSGLRLALSNACKRYIEERGR